MKTFTFLLLLFSFAGTAQETAAYRDLFNQGAYQQCIDNCDSVLQVDSSRSEACFYQGLAFRSLYRFPEAASCFARGMQISPGDLIYAMSLAGALEMQGNIDSARRVYQYVLERDSLYVQAKVKLAALYYQQDDFLKAADFYSQLVRTDSLNAYFFRQLAQSCWQLSLKEAALHYFEQACWLNPDDVLSKQKLLSGYIAVQNYDSATYFVDSFLQIAPHNLFFLQKQALLFALKEDHLDAVRAYRNLTERGDSSLLTAKYYGQSLYENGNYEEAVYWLERYLAKKPHDQNNQFVAALACRQGYLYERSLQHFALVADLAYNPELISRIYSEQALCHMKYGTYCGYRDSLKYKQTNLYLRAENDLKNCLKHAPHNAANYLNLASLYDEQLNNWDQALYYYQEYLKRIDDDKVEAYRIELVQGRMEAIKEKRHMLGE